MDFIYYIDYFHDGGLNGIYHEGDTIAFHLNSAELLVSDNRDKIKLDENNCIRGVLILTNPRNIKVNRRDFSGTLSLDYDDGEVLDFEIKDHKVELGIRWVDYPPKPDPCEYSMIKIEAEQILWQDALNDVTVDLTGLWTGAPPQGEK